MSCSIRNSTLYVLVILTAPCVAFGNDLRQKVFEQSPYDSTSITPDVIIEVCSDVIKNRKNENQQDLEKALELRAGAYFGLRQFDKALADFDELCQLQPKNARAVCARGTVHLRMKQFQAAMKDTEEAIRIDPQYSGAHSQLAIILANSDRMDLAFDAANKAIALDKTNAGGHYVRALKHYQENDFAECLSDLKCFSESYSTGNFGEMEKVYHMRGTALFTLNRHKEAMIQLSMARKMNPSSPAVWSMCFIYASQKKWHMVVHLAEDGLQKTTSYPEGHLIAALAYAHLGQRKDALASIEKGRRMLERVDPVTLGSIYVALGEYRDGLAYYDQALKADSDDSAALGGKVALLAACSDPKYRDGPLALKLALRIHRDPNRSEYEKWLSFSLMADAHAECGQFPEAIENAKKAIEVAGPDHAVRDELLERVRLFEKRTAFRIRNAH
jgi:tetratricopeptide (TPR) repeat protein